MRPPFFAFYPADFANDLNVEAMGTLAVGAYILLLCKAWQSDPPCSLPNDDQILARLARLDAVQWAEVSAGVLACFELRADGRYYQKRLRKEYDKALAAMKGRRKGGARGAQITNARRADASGKVVGSPVGSPVGSADDSPADSAGPQTGRLEIGDSTSSSKKSGDKAPGAGGKKKPPNPNHAPAIAIFCEAWQAKYGRKYAFVRGKDADAIVWLLAQLDNDLDAFRALVKRYLADSDAFVVGNAHDLGTLRGKANRWLVELRVYRPPSDPLASLEIARRLTDDSSGGLHPLLAAKQNRKEDTDAKPGSAAGAS